MISFRFMHSLQETVSCRHRICVMCMPNMAPQAQQTIPENRLFTRRHFARVCYLQVYPRFQCYYTPTVTSRQYDRRASFFLAKSDFQDGGIVDLSDLGGPLSSVFFYLSMAVIALAYLAVMYTHRPTAV